MPRRVVGNGMKLVTVLCGLFLGKILCVPFHFCRRMDDQTRWESLPENLRGRCRIMAGRVVLVGGIA